MAETALQPNKILAMEARPAYASQGHHRGQELVEANDVMMPRLAVCQSMTPQRKKSDPSYIPGLEEGMLFNTISSHIYGTKVLVTPVLFYKSRIYFQDMESGGGVLCQAPDNKSGPLSPQGCNVCPHSQWSAEGRKPDCTELMNFVCILPETRELIVVSFKSTGIRVAKKFNSLIRFRNADSFAGAYVITTVTDKNAAGQEYYTFNVENAGWVDPDIYKFAEDAYTALSSAMKVKPLNVDVAGVDDGLAEEFRFGANANNNEL